MDLSPQEVANWKNDNGITSEYGALHYPWITIQDKDPAAQGAEISVPNSFFMIGLYSRVDNAAGKGVAKTAAGVNDGRIFDAVKQRQTHLMSKETEI